MTTSSPTPTILIVEDETPLRKVLSKKIENLGYTILTANNGVEAIDIFLKKNPDLILLDIVMPEKNGFEVAEEIRIKYKSTVPILIISNLSGPEDIETANRLGVNEFIQKSNISLREVVLKVNELLQ